MPKLELAASLKSYCQSPVNSILASLKGREQEVSWQKSSNRLLGKLSKSVKEKPLNK